MAQVRRALHADPGESADPEFLREEELLDAFGEEDRTRHESDENDGRWRTFFTHRAPSGVRIEDRRSVGVTTCMNGTASAW
jgi:hypothetical protein